jgi:cystine transport system substrate-binding protein
MKNAFIAAIIGGLIVLGGMKFLAGAPAGENAAPAHSAFEHVMATHTLRCAYAAYDPFLIVGTNKNITGIFHDVVEEAAKRLDLKVEWVEEVGYGNINTGFMTGRYDAFCAGLWPAGSRAASTLFSQPIVWEPVGVWVRGNDTRFDGHPEALNDPAYKIAVIDGDATVAMADALFPKAGRTSLSQNQTVGEEAMQVTTGKADAVFHSYMIADKFLATSPGAIKDLSPGKPALIYALTVGFNQGEFALRDMMNVVLDDMERDGTIGRIVKTYLGDKSNLVFRKQDQYAPY